MKNGIVTFLVAGASAAVGVVAGLFLYNKFLSK
jgi:hypothetical protein